MLQQEGPGAQRLGRTSRVWEQAAGTQEDYPRWLRALPRLSTGGSNNLEQRAKGRALEALDNLRDLRGKLPKLRRLAQLPATLQVGQNGG